MQTAFLVSATSALITGSASAAFTGYSVEATTIPSGGQSFVRYRLFANFNGATDRPLNVFNLSLAAGSTSAAFCGFNNPDDSWSPPGGVPSQADSYLMWGNTSTPTAISPSISGDCLVGGLGWTTSNPPSAPLPMPSFQLGQFVLASGDTLARVFSLRIAYTGGAGSPVQFGDATFALPAPGALAVLGLAGLVRRPRR